MSLDMLQQLHETLRTHDIEVLQEIAEEMDRLWLNPDEYEAAADDWEAIHGESYIADQDTHLVFHLGIGFGIEYERQYPTDDPDAWPEPTSVQEAE